MPLTLEATPSATVLHLVGDIDIVLAAQLHQLLLEALAQPTPVHVDLQQASTLNITSVQLLLAAHRHASELGHTFLVQTPIPASIAAALSLVGLQLPTVAP